MAQVNTQAKTETAEEKLARVLAENEQLRAQVNAAGSKSLRLKVSEKGAVQINGLGRFPTTLYKEQMLRVLDMEKEIRAFIKANDSVLSSKADKVIAAAS